MIRIMLINGYRPGGCGARWPRWSQNAWTRHHGADALPHGFWTPAWQQRSIAAAWLTTLPAPSGTHSRRSRLERALLVSVVSTNRISPPPLSYQTVFRILYAIPRCTSCPLLRHVAQQIFYYVVLQLQVIACGSLQISREKLSSVTQVCRCQ